MATLIAVVAFMLTVAAGALLSLERKMPSECPKLLHTDSSGFPRDNRRRLSIKNPFARSGGVPTGAIYIAALCQYHRHRIVTVYIV